MKKIGNFIVIVIFLVFAGVAAFYFSFKISTSKQEQKQEEQAVIANEVKNQEEAEKKIVLKPGNYTVNEIREDEAGVTNEECGVEIKENKYFEIYMGWGAWHTGKYEIVDDELICKSTVFEWESGGYGRKDTDVVFTFKILDENKLELKDIQINTEDKEGLVYDDGLEIGMTYSKK